MASRSEAMRPALSGTGNSAWQQRLFFLGMTIIRVGFGLVFLTNGFAKLGAQENKIPPFKGFLITRDGARSILQADTAGHPIGIYKDFVDNVVLEHWGLFGGLVTASELFIGVCLVLGVVTPIAALMAAGFQLHINFANIHHDDKWLWEAAVEWMPLLGIALMRAGRYWGLDSRLAKRFPRWPVT
jgi:uncharacterized membrane protein YphA (DoxX/SURF4 family)